MDANWISNMAKILTCEILSEMADIPMELYSHRCMPLSSLDTLCGLVDGDYRMTVHFRAEPRFFYRLAKNMICGEPEDAEEIQEYAREFFNTLCGRFISEIYRMTQIPARFYPIEYETAEIHQPGDEKECTILHFLSDEQEYAELSWPIKPMEDLLRRSVKE